MWNDRRTTAFRLATERIPTRRENAGPQVRRLRSLAAELPVFFWRGARGRGTLGRGLRGPATGARGHLPIDERRDLRGDLVLQRLRLVSGELLVARGLVDLCVAREAQRRDQARPVLSVRAVGDRRETRPRQLRLKFLRGKAQVLGRRREEVTEHRLDLRPR